MRVGLFGGSFDPPHEGHAHVAKTALRRLKLDRVIWLVSPGNPLKGRPHADFAHRLAAVRRLASEPRMIVSDLEARLGSPYSADTLAWLSRRFPGVRFFWVMGSDSLEGFHRWRRWRRIGALAALVVVPRPGRTARATLAERALRIRWVSARLHPASSTALRARAMP